MIASLIHTMRLKPNDSKEKYEQLASKTKPASHFNSNTGYLGHV